MKSLVVYDSQFGNTKKIAEMIAETVKGKAVHVRDYKKEMLTGVALLVTGCPIIGWRPSDGMVSFLSSLPEKSLIGVNIAAFDTRIKTFFSGDAVHKVNSQLMKLGGKSIVDPEKFYVKGKEGPLIDGELDKAKTWALQMLGQSQKS
jgi:flavodoxin